MVRLIDPSNSYSGKHLLKILDSQHRKLTFKKQQIRCHFWINDLRNLCCA